MWLKRLRYRSWHRGCKETDLVLGTYCDRHLDGMDEPALGLYEALLDEDDADIWNWLTGKAACPRAEFAPLIEALKSQPLS
ncbi:MAG: succinate dehydrogenase assembly factor 2 [Alphaproteobacteria bacterium]